MSVCYKHLSLEERSTIMVGLAQGLSLSSFISRQALIKSALAAVAALSDGRYFREVARMFRPLRWPGRLQ
jgi:Helix-turn-helix domain